MSKITVVDKIGIFVFGAIFAFGGTYAMWLESNGRYMEMNMLLYAVWLFLETPVILVMLLTKSDAILYIATFIWWFLLGGFVVSIPIFLNKIFHENTE